MGKFFACCSSENVTNVLLYLYGAFWVEVSRKDAEAEFLENGVLACLWDFFELVDSLVYLFFYVWFFKVSDSGDEIVVGVNGYGIPLAE